VPPSRTAAADPVATLFERRPRDRTRKRECSAGRALKAGAGSTTNCSEAQ
jgi:hypothetical protein